MFYTYILQSAKDSTYYIGHTKDIQKRLIQHNQGRTRFTKNKRPWKLIHQEFFLTKQESYARELKIKSYKGGEAFKRLIRQ